MIWIKLKNQNWVEIGLYLTFFVRINVSGLDASLWCQPLEDVGAVVGDVGQDRALLNRVAAEDDLRAEITNSVRTYNKIFRSLEINLIITSLLAFDKKNFKSILPLDKLLVQFSITYYLIVLKNQPLRPQDPFDGTNS